MQKISKFVICMAAFSVVSWLPSHSWADGLEDVMKDLHERIKNHQAKDNVPPKREPSRNEVVEDPKEKRRSLCSYRIYRLWDSYRALLWYYEVMQKQNASTEELEKIYTEIERILKFIQELAMNEGIDRCNDRWWLDAGTVEFIRHCFFKLPKREKRPIIQPCLPDQKRSASSDIAKEYEQMSEERKQSYDDVYGQD